MCLVTSPVNESEASVDLVNKNLHKKNSEVSITTRPTSASFSLICQVTKNWSIKDGAYCCYCAYGLRISRYSDFLSVMLTNSGIFLRGLKLSGESRF